MKLRSLFVMPVLALALLVLSSPSSATANHVGPLFSQSAIPDTDGDGIANEFDMDDDNDGVIDIDDPEPLNPAAPGVNAPPVPQPGTSLSDVDGDGLADDLDLDDDSDGVIDVADPKPVSPEAPGSAPPAAPDPEVEPVNTGNQTHENPLAPEAARVPVVTALPSTGIGTQSPSYLGIALLALVLAAASTIPVRRRAQTVL